MIAFTRMHMPLLAVMPETPLIEYLWIALRWGGLPGFREAPDPPGEVGQLTAGLSAF
jgi:hypothetical protein